MAKFLTDIQPTLKGDSGSGRLEVLSVPDNAQIWFDHRKDGFTNKTSVKKAGQHDVSVVDKPRNLDCMGKVDVPAGGTAHFQCP